jgi:acyl-coenzyme A thioesterase PaaI-like protein
MTTIDDLRAPAPGWTPLPDLAELSATHSFVSGDPAGERIRVALFRRPADDALVGRAWFGPHAEGPPGHAHGGAMAALLDESMGLACWVAGHRVLAKELTVAFRRPLPLQTVVTIECHITNAVDRTVSTTGRLLLPGGAACAEATGTFAVLPPEKLARLFTHRTDGG